MQVVIESLIRDLRRTMTDVLHHSFSFIRETGYLKELRQRCKDDNMLCTKRMTNIMITLGEMEKEISLSYEERACIAIRGECDEHLGLILENTFTKTLSDVEENQHYVTKILKFMGEVIDLYKSVLAHSDEIIRFRISKRHLRNWDLLKEEVDQCMQQIKEKCKTLNAKCTFAEEVLNDLKAEHDKLFRRQSACESQVKRQKLYLHSKIKSSR